MGIEIERKYLLRAFPDLSGSARKVIRQGYISGAEDQVETRLRQANESYFLTVKTGAGLARGEYEVKLTQAQFDALWPATEGRRVEKTRYTAALPDGLSYELDIFEGHLRPLACVEVEFTSEAAAHAFVAPDWFGEDVTEDKRFKNKALAVTRIEDLLG